MTMASPWGLSPSDAAALEARVSREIEQTIRELAPSCDHDPLIILARLITRGYTSKELISHWERYHG